MVETMESALSGIEPFGHKIRMSDEDAAVVVYHLYHGDTASIKKRCLILFKLLIEPDVSNKMPSIKSIAEQIGVSRNTVTKVYDRYLKDGINSIYDDGHKGRVSGLDEYADKIDELFELQPPLTLKDATQIINENLKLNFSQKAVGAWMKSNGYKRKKPRSIPAKADPEEQAAFLDTTLVYLINLALKGEILLYFADGVHLIYGYSGEKCWTKERPMVKSAYGRRRLNCLGFLDAKSFQVTTIMNDSYLNSQSIIEGMVKLRFEHKDDDTPIAIVLDNARYQNNKWVKEIAKYVGVQLFFLPPYSPNLNLIERLWKFLKHEVVANKYYDSFDEFYFHVDDFLDNVHVRYEDELRTLLTFNFEILDGAKAESGTVISSMFDN